MLHKKGPCSVVHLAWGIKPLIWFCAMVGYQTLDKFGLDLLKPLCHKSVDWLVLNTHHLFEVYLLIICWLMKPHKLWIFSYWESKIDKTNNIILNLMHVPWKNKKYHLTNADYLTTQFILQSNKYSSLIEWKYNLQPQSPSNISPPPSNSLAKWCKSCSFTQPYPLQEGTGTFHLKCVTRVLFWRAWMAAPTGINATGCSSFWLTESQEQQQQSFPHCWA